MLYGGEWKESGSRRQCVDETIFGQEEKVEQRTYDRQKATRQRGVVTAKRRENLNEKLQGASPASRNEDAGCWGGLGALRSWGHTTECKRFQVEEQHARNDTRVLIRSRVLGIGYRPKPEKRIFNVSKKWSNVKCWLTRCDRSVALFLWWWG